MDGYQNGMNPYQNQNGYYPMVPGQITGVVPPHSGMATGSMVLGIIGFFIGWCTFGIPSLFAVILGHIGLSETKNGKATGKGQAISGLILGYLVLVPVVAWLLVMGFVYLASEMGIGN